jgi:nucleoid-associated protein YgaU
MLGRLYTVKPGDTLWDIAGKELGNPFRWPELFKHNNKDAVTSKSGMRISDPDSH